MYIYQINKMLSYEDFLFYSIFVNMLNKNYCYYYYCGPPWSYNILRDYLVYNNNNNTTLLNS